jgi:hypothetical protein
VNTTPALTTDALITAWRDADDRYGRREHDWHSIRPVTTLAAGIGIVLTLLGPAPILPALLAAVAIAAAAIHMELVHRAAVVVAIHDPATRVYDVHCSGADKGCGQFYTHSYDTGATNDARMQMRRTAKNEAFIHATVCYAGLPGTDPDATDRG